MQLQPIASVATGDPKTMFLEGLATVQNIDLEKDVVYPDGLKTTWFSKKGIVNWNHDRSEQGVVGFPVSVKRVTEDGRPAVKVKVQLMNNERGKHIYSIAKNLKDSNRPGLGVSIEMVPLEQNKKGDTNHITKSFLCGLAITPTPVNTSSELRLVDKSLNYPICAMAFNSETQDTIPLLAYDGETCGVNVKGEFEVLDKSIFKISYLNEEKNIGIDFTPLIALKAQKQGINGLKNLVNLFNQKNK